jgi:hypothetical protein
MRRALLLLEFLGLIALGACTIAPTAVQPPNPTPSPSPVIALTLEETANQVLQALAEKDLETVASFVHPQQGLRFSPYAFVRDEHQVFMAEDLLGLFDSDKVYVWGRYDGSGEPIALTFADYYAEFVYSSDFADAEQVAVNERLGRGNTVHNIQEFYPGSSFVEYYLPGTEEEYGGLDWESLRLVFLQKGDVWMLVGIVHDEWTI